MKNNKVPFYIILAIIIVLFNVCAFAIHSSFNTPFWITYTFTMFALIMQILIFNNSSLKEKIMKKAFFGYNLIYLDVLYVVLQLLLFILVKSISTFPIWLSFILNTLCLGLFIIVICSLYVSTNKINATEAKVKEKVNYIRSMQIDLELLAKNVTDESIKEKILDLIEKVKYSDPMSNEKLSDLEEKITLKVNDLKNSNDKETIIKDISIMLEERNEKCKLYK